MPRSGSVLIVSPGEWGPAAMATALDGARLERDALAEEFSGTPRASREALFLASARHLAAMPHRAHRCQRSPRSSVNHSFQFLSSTGGTMLCRKIMVPAMVPPIAMAMMALRNVR